MSSRPEDRANMLGMDSEPLEMPMEIGMDRNLRRRRTETELLGRVNPQDPRFTLPEGVVYGSRRRQRPRQDPGVNVFDGERFYEEFTTYNQIKAEMNEPSWNTFPVASRKDIVRLHDLAQEDKELQQLEMQAEIRKDEFRQRFLNMSIDTQENLPNREAAAVPVPTNAATVAKKYYFFAAVLQCLTDRRNAITQEIKKLKILKMNDTDLVSMFGNMLNLDQEDRHPVCQNIKVETVKYGAGIRNADSLL
jgi:hypothetical protein